MVSSQANVIDSTFFDERLIRFENFAKCLEIRKFGNLYCVVLLFRNFPRIVYVLVGRGRIRNRGAIWPKRYMCVYFCARVRNNKVEIPRSIYPIVYLASLTVLKK